MSRRKRPAPPTYMQPTYPPKFPSASSPGRKQPLPSARPKSPADERISQLKALGELHASGVLNDQEFEREKQRILAQP
ncbi:SHOCT domain-containing protein [Dictyobacter kobayashii]|uniref:SHOCT domain-containing protein n=1 Tax=Dictyobacter kobayashii TaxID=2014872 RepID=A0A402AZ21_9CHLR|nr:SHOCT domain-containing protein [Dictyobacter kobayashii]GCE24361.1 hypothetical protein KDK_81610 [Dictyobacter kobayashii]